MQPVKKIRASFFSSSKKTKEATIWPILTSIKKFRNFLFRPPWLKILATFRRSPQKKLLAVNALSVLRAEFRSQSVGLFEIRTVYNKTGIYRSLFKSLVEPRALRWWRRGTLSRASAIAWRVGRTSRRSTLCRRCTLWKVWKVVQKSVRNHKGDSICRSLTLITIAYYLPLPP